MRKNSLDIKNAYGVVWHMESKKLVHHVIHLPIKKREMLRYTLSLQLLIICNTYAGLQHDEIRVLIIFFLANLFCFKFESAIENVRS